MKFGDSSFALNPPSVSIKYRVAVNCTGFLVLKLDQRLPNQLYCDAYKLPNKAEDHLLNQTQSQHDQEWPGL